MVDWRPSRFNITTQTSDGTTILFNTATGQTRYFPQAQYQEEIAPLLPPEGAPEGTQAELLQSLRRGGFLYRAYEDEWERLKKNYARSQYQGDRMTLTIVPSQDCNFACPYCFEREKSGRMSQETAAQTVEFLRSWIYPRTALSLCWYGGEPLLGLDTISWITEQLRPLLQEKQCPLKASIITNGYLLDAAAVTTLLAAGVRVAQITLDGDEETHNRYRVLHDGAPTYRPVLDNLIAAARAGLWINLRINVGMHNRETAFAVIREVAEAGLQHRVTVSFGQLDDLCDNSETARELALSPEAFAKLDYRRLLHLLTMGFKVSWGLDPRPTYCSAVRPSFLMITHDGRLGKCWNRAGNEMEPVGHVSDPTRLSDRFDPHILWDPFARESCRNCAYFPLCAGGCPDRGLRNPEQPVCTPLRYSLEMILKLRYLCQRTGLAS